jgi:hypothetical protein
VTPGETPVISGIVDWENASFRGSPDVDLAHLWLSAQGPDLGAAVRSALGTGAEAFAAWLDDIGVRRAHRVLPARVAVTMAWIEHVAGCVDRTTPTRTWTARTVDEVLPVALDALRGHAGASPTAPEVRAP